MPLYEYQCVNCSSRFEALRAMGESDKPLACPDCGNSKGRRVMSTFATVNNGGGDTRQVASGRSGGCGGCAGGHCASCSH